MTWYNPKSWFTKANPAQYEIHNDYGQTIGSDQVITYKQAFDKLEVVNRGTSLIVNACSSLDFDIKDKKIKAVYPGSVLKQAGVNILLNRAPNPHQSIQTFRENIFTDFILEGNIFIYFDGVHLYHLPAVNVDIITDPVTYIDRYEYGEVKFRPDEIIHIKDLSSDSIYRGTSRLQAANRNIQILWKMQSFQEQFFDNGAVMGLIFASDNTLSPQAKQKTLDYWRANYSPKNGAKKPMILDSGLKPVAGISSDSFKEMDFDTSITRHDVKILKALGVPPLLLDGGNNANISPNLRLFYLETVMPIVRKFTSAMERYFGYDISPVTNDVSALQPDLKDLAAYLSTLVNGGILKPNEAREELRYEKVTGGDEIRVPANIAGSAANPSVGGAPKKE